jgi:hypothetical protein
MTNLPPLPEPDLLPVVDAYSAERVRAYAVEFAAELNQQLVDANELISDLVESLKGYRHEHNDGQPCDAEKLAVEWLCHKEAK